MDTMEVDRQVGFLAVEGTNESQHPAYGLQPDVVDNPSEVFNMNMSGFPYFGEVKSVPAWEAAIKIASYLFIIAMALVGNLLVLITVARTRRLHTTTNFYIVNLAVSDLLVTLMCTWVHLVDDLTEGWVLGAFFCKFNTFAQGEFSILKFVTEFDSA
jgi:hypothetical protein